MPGDVRGRAIHVCADLLTVGSNASVDVDSAQTRVSEIAETWKSPTQAWTIGQISVQAQKNPFEREVLLPEQIRQDFSVNYLFSTLMRQFFHVYSGHFLALLHTFSTLALLKASSSTLTLEPTLTLQWHL